MINFQTQWNKVSDEEKSGFLDHINPTLGAVKYVLPQSVDIKWSPLSFYKGISLIEVSSIRFPDNIVSKFSNMKFLSETPSKMYFLAKDGKTYHLDWRAEPILRANDDHRAEINITADNVLDYLKFTVHFTTGEEDRIHILEDQAQLSDAEQISDAAKTIITNTIVPAEVIEETDENCICRSVQLYSGTLGLVDIAVNKTTGMFEVTNTESLAFDLDVTMKKVDFI